MSALTSDNGAALGRAVEHLLSEQQPSVIVVDDAHLLDDASIALLHHVIRHGHARVLVTSRPGERTELWQEGLLRRCRSATRRPAWRLTGTTVSVTRSWVLASTGDIHAASQSSARQALLMRDFDGVHTPVLRAGDLTHLTLRQTEMAHLATSGLTNQQIAGRLHTSKRTVDNHLHAIYGVLGVTGREELRIALGTA